MGDMAELAGEMSSEDNIFMNDDVDRVDVPDQPWFSMERTLIPDPMP